MRIKNISDWEEILSKYPSSGLTIKDFCLKHDISKTSFYYWSDKLGLDYRKRSKKAVGKFISLSPKASDLLISPSSTIKLSISNQLDMEFSDNCKISPILEIISLFKKC